jgi:hypothetical protein
VWQKTIAIKDRSRDSKPAAVVKFINAAAAVVHQQMPA